MSPPIVVLDDTTSAVDMETETYIQGQLAAREGRHTTFVIAQRISSVKNADCIYIIEDGKIAESGTHGELFGKERLLLRHILPTAGHNPRKRGGGTACLVKS